MQEEEKRNIKEIAKEVAREIIKEEGFRKTVRIEDLEKNKDTSTIRIFDVTKERLKSHCKDTVVTSSQFASIAIEEKMKRDHSK